MVSKFYLQNSGHFALLTHCGLMMPYGKIYLGQHYMHQCWLQISEVLLHSPESNFSGNTQGTILYNQYQNCIFDVTATPQPDSMS